MDERVTLLLWDYRAGRYTRRQFIQKALGLGVSLAALPVLLDAAGVRPASRMMPVASAAGAQRTIVVSNPSPVANPDPPVTASTGYGDTMVINNNIFEGLVRNKVGTVDLEPALARSWDISTDGLTYTFHLRPTLFHDGTPVTASAVKLNFDRQTDEKNPYHLPGMSDTELAFGNVSAVEAPDDHTLVIVQKRPAVTLLPNMALQPEGIVSAAALKQYGKDVAMHPTGTGPFKFVRWTKGVEFVMAANNKYWGGRPWLDQVIWRSASDNTVRLEQLRTGEIDVTTELEFKDVPELRKDSRFQVITGTFLDSQYLILNANKPPFDKKEVHQAFQHAINKANIAKVAFFGNYTLGAGPIPPGVLGYDKMLGQTYAYDPARARALLKQASVPEGFALTLVHRTDGVWPEEAQLIQADLQAVGLKVALQGLDEPAFYAKINASEHQAAINSWGMDTGDPDDIMVPLFSSQRAVQRLGYKNTGVSEMIAAAQTERNPNTRRSIYVKAQQQILQTAGFVSLGYPGHAIGAKASVRGLRLSPLDDVVMRAVRIA
jgi:peptide/nickel transport system substrate-binding protein